MERPIFTETGCQWFNGTWSTGTGATPCRQLNTTVLSVHSLYTAGYVIESAANAGRHVLVLVQSLAKLRFVRLITTPHVLKYLRIS